MPAYQADGFANHQPAVQTGQPPASVSPQRRTRPDHQPTVQPDGLTTGQPHHQQTIQADSVTVTVTTQGPRRPASRPSRRSDDKPEASTPTTANRPSTQLDHQPNVQEDSRPPACIQAAEPHREPAVQADWLTTSQPTKQTAPTPT